MFGRLRIRGKLALVVALPLLAVALLTLPSVFGAVDRVQRSEEIERSMRVANRVTALAFELQQERLLSLGYLFEVVDRSQLVTAATRVDDRIVDIGHAAQRGELRENGLPEPVAAAVTAVEELMEGRAPVLDRSVTAEQVMADYGLVIGQLVDSLQLLDGADLATDAARHVAVLEASLRLNEAAISATHLLLVIAATGSQQAAVQYAVALQPVTEYSNQFNQYATPAQLELLEVSAEAFVDRDVTGVDTAFAADPYEATAGQSAASVFPSIQSLGQLGRFVEKKIITDVLIEVESEQQSALRNAYLVGLGALLVVLLVVTATAVLARTVVRPLLGLTASANRVARVADAELARIADDESEVPEPIRIDPVHVKAQDEIGDLGRAFDRVQAFSIRLVERQVTSRRNVALMFGYLGRRTQNLVGRQLDLIDSLERNETDADRLSDLYRLDHVSSRLRRNAGSLVVLSGGAGGPSDYTAPLPLADIVRLALGEIEDYERVDVDVPPAISVAPAAIGDLVLVLAELMENATTFSPPHTRVTVTATATGYGVEMSIVDQGIGMSPARLAEENARLARRERLDLAPTEVLGLFVVGRLARRHGMRVTLSETTGGGVTAVVELHRGHLLPGETSARAGSAPPIRRDGHAPANSSPGKPAQASAPGLEPALFDLDALSRASRTLETGRSWNAFAVSPAALPPSPAAPSPAAPSPAAPPAAPAPSAPPPAAPPSTPQPEPPPSTPTPAVPTAPGSPSGPPAQRPAETSTGTVYTTTTTAGAASEAATAGAAPAPPDGAPTGLSGLRRRVPGATLAAQPPPAARRPRQPPSASDPEKARELVEQLQTGVTRALSEIQSHDGPAA